MKRNLVFCAAICAVVAFSSCKSQESAYKKFYEKAKAQEQIQNANNPITEREPVGNTTPVQPNREVASDQATVVDNSDNTPVRQEKVTLVSGAGLRNFSVVVGSFSVRANAEALQQTLRNAGYAAQIVKNEERNMFRVVAGTYDQKSAAVSAKSELSRTYRDAWLLYQK